MIRMTTICAAFTLVLLGICLTGCGADQAATKIGGGMDRQFRQKAEKIQQALDKIGEAMSNNADRKAERFQHLRDTLVTKYKEGHRAPKLVFFPEDAAAPAEAATEPVSADGTPAALPVLPPKEIKAALLAQDTLDHRGLRLLWNLGLDGSGVRYADLNDGYLYVVTRHNNIYCIEARTGLTRWIYPLARRPDTPPGFNDLYLVISAGDTIHVIDKLAGQDKWSFETDIQPASRPYCDSSYFVFGTWTGGVHGFQFGDMFPTWRFDAGGAVFAMPYYGDGIAYAATDDGIFVRHNVVSGLTGSTIDLGGRPGGDMLAGGNLLFVGTERFEFNALSIHNPEVAWTHNCAGRVVGGPWVSTDGQVVYYSSDEDGLYAVTAVTGRERWKLADGLRPLAVSGDRVFVLRADGSVCNADAGTGKVLWSEPLEPFTATVAQMQTETMYLFSDDGQVFAVAPKK